MQTLEHHHFDDLGADVCEPSMVETFDALMLECEELNSRISHHEALQALWTQGSCIRPSEHSAVCYMRDVRELERKYNTLVILINRMLQSRDAGIPEDVMETLPDFRADISAWLQGQTVDTVESLHRDMDAIATMGDFRTQGIEKRLEAERYILMTREIMRDKVGNLMQLAHMRSHLTHDEEGLVSDLYHVLEIGSARPVRVEEDVTEYVAA